MINRHTVFEIHRLYHEGLSKQRIADTIHIDPKTVRKFLIDPDPKRIPVTRPSKLDPYKEEIQRLLEIDAKAPATVILQRIAPLGFGAVASPFSKTICTPFEATSKIKRPSSALSLCQGSSARLIGATSDPSPTGIQHASSTAWRSWNATAAFFTWSSLTPSDRRPSTAAFSMRFVFSRAPQKNWSQITC